MKAPRIDANHREIVEALEAVGATVQPLIKIGKGCPDILCAYRGNLFLMEIKTRDGKLTADQIEWMAKWRSPVYVVHTVDEALKVIGAI